MVSPRRARSGIHALLHDRPIAFVGYDKIMLIQLEAVLDGVVIDLCTEFACAYERGTVESCGIG